MSKAATDRSSDSQEEIRKVANLMTIRGGLSGVRWLLGRAAGPAMRGSGLGAKVYNYGIRPLRGAIMPNLGSTGNRIRMGAAAYSAGHIAAVADGKFRQTRDTLVETSKDLSPEAQSMIKARVTRLGAIGAALKSTTGLFQRSASPFEVAADDAVREGLAQAVKSGVEKHRVDTYDANSLSSALNPLGSRLMASGMSKLVGKPKDMSEIASSFSTKYKGLLSGAQAGFAGAKSYMNKPTPPPSAPPPTQLPTLPKQQL